VANYILGDEALYAYLIGRHESANKPTNAQFQGWAKQRTSQDYIFASRMSVAMLAAAIERIPDILKRESARSALNSKLISQFKDSMLEVDESVLKHWSTLRAAADDTAAKKLSSEQMLEVATAIHTGYIYVARLSDPLKIIQQARTGFTIDDPWK
jgi:hypothetical protein